MTPKADAHTGQQALSPASENILLEHIQSSAATGFPLNPADVQEFAQTLARGSTDNSGSAKLGTNWFLLFLVRHPSIQSTWSRCLENARIRGTDEDSIWKWFGRLQDAITEYKISSSNIFNMDETGFVFGLSGSQRVIVPGGDPAGRFKAQPGNRQNTTVIEAIGSGGQVLLPLIITKGKLHTVGEQQRMEDIPTTWQFSKGPSSWTDNELAVLWVENVFDVNIRPSTPSEHHLLIINGHTSHTSSTFLDALWQKNIVPLCLPPHATYIMQPLDVSIFGPLTAAYRRLVTKLTPHVAAAGIDKVQFGTLYAQARVKVLTPAAAMRAFRDSRITTHPVPEKVLNRLVGLANAPHRSSVAQPVAELPAPIPRTLDALDATLTAVRNAKDARDLRQLKHPILEAFHAERMEKEEAQAKVVLLEAQLEQNKVIAKKARPEKRPGDRMVLTKDRMVTREEAERALAEKQLAIDQAQQQARRMEECRATANDDEQHNEEEEEVLPLLLPSPPPPNAFLDVLDNGEPLSAVDDDDDDPFGR